MTPGIKQRKRKLTAKTADRHHLYQLSVQCVEAEIDTVSNIYKRLRGRHGAILREDFCGTGNLCCEWVRRRRGNTAIGFDLDAEVLAWGRQHNVAKLSQQQQDRVRLQPHDVLHSSDTGADLIVAMNFSYMTFKTRQQLRTYFSAARDGLADDGMLFLDCYGGYESWRELKEKSKFKGFSYIWQHSKFNPISGDMLCHIHFKFPDGTMMKRAFTYDWRMWTLPEIRELLAEAGFAKSTVYWEGTDKKTGQGNDIYSPTEQGEDEPSWIAYLTAEK